MLKTLLPLLPVDEATKLGIRRIIQQQGDIVVTCPGIAFHWTLSTGISLAESANFLLPAATQAEDAHARAAAEAWLSTPGPQQELQRRVQSLMAKTASWQDLSMHHMFAAAVGLAKAADDGLQCGSLQAAGLDNLASSMAAVWQVLGTLAVAWHKVLPPTYPKAVAAAAAAAGEDDG